MSMMQFTQNYTDHSNDQGYQFEFHCDRCANGFRSSFEPSKLGMATNLLKAAGGFFGGMMGRAASAGEFLKDSLRGEAWDSAFAAAVTEGKQKFKQCRKCAKWVCPEVCWNEQRSLCVNCAPNLEAEAASIQARVAVDQISEKARTVDQTGGMDMKASHSGACPSCNAPSSGGKFCASCGKPLAQSSKCSKCSTDLQAGAKFCPECGTHT